MLIAIEEHRTTTELNAALAAQSGVALDPSLRFNTMGDHADRLTDLNARRLATMDELGITTSLLGLIPPGPSPCPPPTPSTSAATPTTEPPTPSPLTPTGSPP
jgi:hypothetical protein